LTNFDTKAHQEQVYNKGMIMKKPVVLVVDDDESVCKALERLMKSVGLDVRTFTSAESFLNLDCHNVPCCLVLYMRMPVIDGLQLQEKLARSGSQIPIIFISAHEDDRAREKGLRAGAMAFFHKPFEDQALIDAVYSAISKFQTEEHNDRPNPVRTHPSCGILQRSKKSFMKKDYNNLEIHIFTLFLTIIAHDVNDLAFYETLFN
jgi:FixJ family two-component response regulator